jgi:hypothetical protein
MNTITRTGLTITIILAATALLLWAIVALGWADGLNGVTG